MEDYGRIVVRTKIFVRISIISYATSSVRLLWHAACFSVYARCVKGKVKIVLIVQTVPALVVTTAICNFHSLFGPLL